MADPLFNLVLFQPEIPNNTGNIGRTALATGCRLHIIHPIGFSMEAKARRRAGLDYWENLDVVEHADWDAYLRTEAPRQLWLFSTKAQRSFREPTYAHGDHLLFGGESAGVAPPVHDWVQTQFGPDHRLRIPMAPLQSARSLNLATAVAIATYEALRSIQDGF